MPKEIFPSSYLCDCGYQCDFSENTVKEVKAASLKRRQHLIADDDQHEVAFVNGEMIDIICPSRKNLNRKGRGGKRILLCPE